MNKQVILENAAKVLRFEEGYDGTVYIDSEGYPTTGIGLKVGSKRQPIGDFNDFPFMPEGVALVWTQYLVNDLYETMESVDAFADIWATIDDDRRVILLSMAYQLGVNGLRKFKNTLLLLEEKSYGAAAIEMLDSRWARQTEYRAVRHAEVIRTGNLREAYDL